MRASFDYPAPHSDRSRVTSLAGVILGLGCFVGPAVAFEAGQPVTMPDAARVFEYINPAVQMATAWGDRESGPHGTFGIFPPNFETPMHTHTGAYHGIVIKGVMANPFEGDDFIADLPPGSYWYVPANAVHVTACISETPCEFYFQSDGGFDFLPAE